MAIDHYVAIIKPLHHGRLLSKRLTRKLILFCWALAFLFGYSDFYVEFYKIHETRNAHGVNVCEAIYITKYQEEYCIFALTAVVYPLMLILYIRLCVYIQRRKPPGSSHSKSFNLRQTKNKKSFVTTLIILGTFTVCWLPNCLFQTTMSVYAEITWPKAPESSTLNLFTSSW